MTGPCKVAEGKALQVAPLGATWVAWVALVQGWVIGFPRTAVSTAVGMPTSVVQ